MLKYEKKVFKRIAPSITRQIIVNALFVPPGLLNMEENHSLKLLMGFQLEAFLDGACITFPCLNSSIKKGPRRPKEKTLNKAASILNPK